MTDFLESAQAMQNIKTRKKRNDGTVAFWVCFWCLFTYAAAVALVYLYAYSAEISY